MQEYNLKLTPGTPPTISFTPLLIKPHSPHTPPVPCNLSSSRRIGYRTRSKPGVVSVYPTIIFFKFTEHWKRFERMKKETNADLDHFYKPTTYTLNLSSNPPSLQMPTQELTRMRDCCCVSINSVNNQLFTSKGHSPLPSESTISALIPPVFAPPTSLALLSTMLLPGTANNSIPS